MSVSIFPSYFSWLQSRHPALVLAAIAMVISLAGPVGYDHRPGEVKEGSRLDDLVSLTADQHRAIFLFQPIDLNLADAEVLASLAGIGPKLAARIVDWRELNGGFKDVSELVKVKGIGQAKLDLVINELTVMPKDEVN